MMMQGIPFMQVLEYRVPAGMHQLVEDPSLQHLHQLAVAGKYTSREFQGSRKRALWIRSIFLHCSEHAMLFNRARIVAARERVPDLRGALSSITSIPVFGAVCLFGQSVVCSLSA
jgi:hypothetical protein